MDILHLTGTFGRLDHDELTLSPGLNLLYAPNESGKSTWGAFIRTMLYGLSTRERGPLADKNRYAPWNGAPLQGRMDVSANGESYTLLRETPRRLSHGRVHLHLYRHRYARPQHHRAERRRDAAGRAPRGL
mgnify:CR=1 FL=1